MVGQQLDWCSIISVDLKLQPKQHLHLPSSLEKKKNHKSLRVLPTPLALTSDFLIPERFIKPQRPAVLPRGDKTELQARAEVASPAMTAHFLEQSANLHPSDLIGPNRRWQQRRLSPRPSSMTQGVNIPSSVNAIPSFPTYILVKTNLLMTWTNHACLF